MFKFGKYILIPVFVFSFLTCPATVSISGPGVGAYIDQVDHVSVVEQTGDNNLAEVYSPTDWSSAYINQVGDHNQAEQNIFPAAADMAQPGTAGPFWSHSIEQFGDYNVAKQTDNASYRYNSLGLQMEIVQGSEDVSEGFNNFAEQITYDNTSIQAIHQFGSRNEAFQKIVSEAEFTDEFGNIMRTDQETSDSFAEIIMLVGTGFGYKNYASIYQAGIGENNASITVTGSYNNAGISQTGGGNIASITQENNDNYGRITQNGFNNEAFLIQIGGDHYVITQTGDNNKATITSGTAP